ncbi:MAG: hypothetical protein RIG77_22295 [Cyclobacteriaceae bacterium]
MGKNIQLDKLALILFLYSSFLPDGQVLAQDGDTDNTPLLERAIELRFVTPDSAHYWFERSYQNALLSGDTLGAVDALVEQAQLFAHNANFSNSYDIYWKALFLAEQMDNPSAIANVYNGLGWLYSLFYKNKEAINYFNKSLGILKEHGGSAKEMGREYYALLTLFRKQKNTTHVRAYLDSCLSLKRKTDLKTGIYLKAEEGYLHFMEGNAQKALETLLPLVATFEQVQHSYLVILSYYIAQAYESLRENGKALDFYNKSLAIGRQYKSHQDMIPDVLVMQAKLSFKMQRFSEAFYAMEMAKTMNDSLFSSRSKLNQSLLEIKDEFRLEKERQDKLEKEKRIQVLEQEERLSQLRMMTNYVTVLFLALLGVVYYRYLRSKHKSEKKLLSEKQRIEMEKANEVLELKNKELTASALQILKRDGTINQIKQQIAEQKHNPDDNKLGAIVNTINLSQADDWKQFESRFLSVNKNFYASLKAQYPKLSPADHKICALIKLGFDSVDMSKLLNIAVESVHTTRYRLRKKMNLSRQDKLEELIIGIN